MLLENQEKNSRVLVFVLAYNEAKNLPSILSEIKENLSDADFEYKILVINDGSKDETENVLTDSEVSIITHPFNLGIGASEQTGLIYAFNKNFDIAVRLDGDGQHPPSAIKEILKKQKESGAHLVIGSRFKKGDKKGFKSTFIRRIGIKYFSLLCWALTGIRIHDPTSGFRCYNREAIRFFTNIPPSDYPEVESIIDGIKNGLIIEEVPVSFKERSSGKSTIKFFEKIYYIIKVTIAIIVASMRKPSEDFKLTHRGENNG